MTVEDAELFCRQADELEWKPRIILIGGEPTLHPDLLQFIKIAARFNSTQGGVELWSNGYGNNAKKILDQVRNDAVATVIEGTIKRGDVTHETQDIFLSPADRGLVRKPCGTHACVTWPDCGISVDHEGYTLCCMGGAIDGIFKLGCRTTKLADLFDEKFAMQQTATLCANCGQHLGTRGHDIVQAKTIYGTRMSPAWAVAAERIMRS
jgi:hypothetical protein